MRVVLSCLACAASLTIADGALGQLFQLTGIAPGATGSRAYGLSADGNVAAGYSLSSSPYNPGFRWTRAGGREDFGLESGLPGASIGFGISGDGSTVIGHAWEPNGPSVAYRWRGPGTFQTLGYVPGTDRSQAYGANNDGSIVVGRSVWAEAPDNVGMAFRWTQQTGMQGLGFGRPGDIYSSAEAISRDGSTIVGFTKSGSGDTAGFVWTASDGMQVLPELPAPPNSVTIARATNHNGSIIVGQSGSGSQMAMWRGGQVFDLGVAPGWGYAQANGVSDDGMVVVGMMELGLPHTAAVWTPTRGMEPLAQYLAACGLVIPAEWRLRDCFAVSSDGLTFAGIAVANGPGGHQGFIATIPAPATLTIFIGFGVANRRRCRVASM